MSLRFHSHINFIFECNSVTDIEYISTCMYLFMYVFIYVCMVGGGLQQKMEEDIRGNVMRYVVQVLETDLLSHLPTYIDTRGWILDYRAIVYNFFSH